MHAYLPTKIWYLDTGESDSKEMTKNRPIAKNGLIEWYDWLANHIFETGKLVIFFKKEKIKSHFNSEDKPIRIKPIFEKDFFEFNCNGDRNEGLLLEEYLKKGLRRKYEKYWFCLYVDRSYCKCLKTSLNLYESYMAKKTRKLQ